MNRSKIYIIAIVLGLVPISSTYGQSQASTITLEQALNIARKSNASLKSGKYEIDRQNKLADAGALKPFSQIFMSGEEFNFSGEQGIHSLNLYQNFYLPKVNKAQRNVYQHSAVLANQQLKLTDQELKREVEKAFYDVVFANGAFELASENLELYNAFLSITTTQLESGESGKIPQQAAKMSRGQATLTTGLAQERYEVALAIFNQWLHTDIQYTVESELPVPIELKHDSIAQQNPHLQLKRARIDLASAEVERQEAQLTPQINSGLRLQNANGKFPLLGYQLGLNIPLFRKAYHGHIEAAELKVKVEENALQATKDNMQRTVQRITAEMRIRLKTLDYILNELTPIATEQSDILRIAYWEGEIGYLEYLNSLKQEANAKKQYLVALYEFNALQIELNFWLGN